MKKLVYLFVLIFLLNTGLFQVKAESTDFRGQTLTIYNVEDYISNGDDDYVDIIANFEEEYGVKVNYYTYDTNETMYNQFTLQKEGTYDLVCTSDYMIQKMIKEDLVMPMDDYETNIPHYYKYSSPALRTKLKEMIVPYKDTEVTLDEFAVGYMWGTLGIVYDPLYTDTICEDVKSWDIFWDPTYNNVISIKNSIRDAFVVGLMHSYSKSDEFKKAKELYLNDPTEENLNNYQKLVQEIFDFKLDGSYESDSENLEKIARVKEELISMKENIFGFEVDSGKNDIITGKIKMNLAYSGDAVYSIDTALADRNLQLEYYVPEDGSNIWYDAWVLPKGSNKELAYLFLDYLSVPQNAADNMDYIGYTPYIVGNELFTLTGKWYGACDYDVNASYYVDDEACVIYNNQLYLCIKDKESDELVYPDNEEYFESLEYDSETEYFEGDMVSYNGEIYNCIYFDESNPDAGITNAIDNPDAFEIVEGYDLTFLYEGTLSENRRAIIYPYLGCENQLQAQYPSEEIIARCAIMNDFGSYNENVVIMWGQVKAYTNMVPIYIFLSTFVMIVVVGIVIFAIKTKINNKYKKN